MSSTILSGDFTVYYLSETRQKRIVWSGTTGTYSVRALYTALQDLFDESAQMDDGTVMYALTPTEYQIGLIDLDDTQDPWYIDGTTTEHLYGGGLVSKDYSRVVTVRTGMVVIKRSGTNIVSGDIGNTITHADGDSGTLLFVSGEYLVIRPASNAATNNWDSTSGDVTCNSHVDTQILAAATGGTTWANIYTIGTIASGTSIYLIQNGTKITAWWSTGHIDILQRIVTQGTLVDSGVVTIFAREYGKLYDHYQATLTTGGRSPVPLATSADLNNTTLEATIAALSGITFTFGADTKDLSNGNGLQPYDVVINCGENTIKNFYEYTKYVTRRTSSTSLNGLNGEQYTGTGEIQLNYDGQSGSFTEGQIVTSAGGATGYITADHNNGDNTGILVLRTVRGTFVDDEAITDPITGAALVNGTPETLIEVKTAPFGTFAGGKFYGARGVYVYNMAAADANNYQLTDSDGDTQSPPVTVATTITVQDLSTGSVIEGASVLLWVTDNSNYFYRSSVSITGLNTTATVTHTDHGLSTDDYVVIEGVSNEDDYNGVHQVTVTSTSEYTYSTNENIDFSPATGTITSTFAIISGTTNASGVVSDSRSLSVDQPVSGWVRKSSSSPYYQQGVISGTIDSDSGLSVIIQLARDE